MLDGSLFFLCIPWGSIYHKNKCMWTWRCDTDTFVNFFLNFFIVFKCIKDPRCVNYNNFATKSFYKVLWTITCYWWSWNCRLKERFSEDSIPCRAFPRSGFPDNYQSNLFISFFFGDFFDCENNKIQIVLKSFKFTGK